MLLSPILLYATVNPNYLPNLFDPLWAAGWGSTDPTVDDSPTRGRSLNAGRLLGWDVPVLPTLGAISEGEFLNRETLPLLCAPLKGDSGGAVFADRDGRFELVGLLRTGKAYLWLGHFGNAVWNSLDHAHVHPPLPPMFNFRKVSLDQTSFLHSGIPHLSSHSIVTAGAILYDEFFIPLAQDWNSHTEPLTWTHAQAERESMGAISPIGGGVVSYVNYPGDSSSPFATVSISTVTSGNLSISGTRSSIVTEIDWQTTSTVDTWFADPLLGWMWVLYTSFNNGLVDGSRFDFEDVALKTGEIRLPLRLQANGRAPIMLNGLVTCEHSAGNPVIGHASIRLVRDWHGDGDVSTLSFIGTRDIVVPRSANLQPPAIAGFPLLFPSNNHLQTDSFGARTIELPINETQAGSFVLGNRNVNTPTWKITPGDYVLVIDFVLQQPSLVELIDSADGPVSLSQTSSGNFRITLTPSY